MRVALDTRLRGHDGEGVVRAERHPSRRCAPQGECTFYVSIFSPPAQISSKGVSIIEIVTPDVIRGPGRQARFVRAALDTRLRGYDGEGAVRAEKHPSRRCASQGECIFYVSIFSPPSQISS
jgi:hypothetical protein